MFNDRDDAARQLVGHLQRFKGQNPLVLAIPRGAVPMGQIIAQALDGELDVALVRKLTAPHAPEVAVGSIDESGWTYVAPFAASVGADKAYLAKEQARQSETIRQRRAQYTPIRPPIDPAGRVVIVVDDGLATGATMVAALHGLRGRHHGGRPARPARAPAGHLGVRGACVIARGIGAHPASCRRGGVPVNTRIFPGGGAVLPSLPADRRRRGDSPAEGLTPQAIRVVRQARRPRQRWRPFRHAAPWARA